MPDTSTATRTPHRRAGAIALLTVPVAMLAYASLTTVWYTFNIQAPQLTVPGSFTKTGQIAATQTYTAFSLTQAGTATGPTGPFAALPSVSGMPTIMVFLIAAALLAFAATTMRNSLFAIGGAIAANFAKSNFEAMRALVENPMFGGNYMTTGPGLERFELASMSMIALCATVGIQVFLANRAERKLKQAAGDASPSTLEQIYSFYVGAVKRSSKDSADTTSKSGANA